MFIKKVKEKLLCNLSCSSEPCTEFTGNSGKKTQSLPHTNTSKEEQKV